MSWIEEGCAKMGIQIFCDFVNIATTSFRVSRSDVIQDFLTIISRWILDFFKFIQKEF